MPFLTEVHFQNYRSFLDAKCRLSPVTVVIGANNAGKSNFLRGLTTASGDLLNMTSKLTILQHRRTDRELAPSRISIAGEEGQYVWSEQWKPRDTIGGQSGTESWVSDRFSPPPAALYSLDDRIIGIAEQETEEPMVYGDGRGVTSVLKFLDERNPSVFEAFQREFNQYVPEILRVICVGKFPDKIELKVLERGIDKAGWLREVSSGTRTVLAVLTIIYQPHRPELILIEDIEHAIHPRGLKPLVETMRRISKEHGVQIIFTTQSPYVLDAFQDPEHWDAVVIVEKRDGVSTLTNAKDRLIALGYEREMDIVPLGDLWYSGLLGGVAGPNELWDEEKTKS